MSVVRYTMLLAAVGLGRLIELRLSRRHQRQLAGRGAGKVVEPHFRWMVLLHGGVLLGAALEVRLLRRRFIRALGAPMGILWLLANALRWWVIRTMGQHWNVEVIDSTRLGVVTSGPFRYIRHPNYLAVAVEVFALPLIHTAWLTAAVLGGANLAVLAVRIRAEDRALGAGAAARAG